MGTLLLGIIWRLFKHVFRCVLNTYFDTSFFVNLILTYLKVYVKVEEYPTLWHDFNESISRAHGSKVGIEVIEPLA